jgi:RNA polymerase sigma-70 factor, ECF subfamily
VTGPHDPDLDVVKRLQAGDEAAFDEIMARYRRPILSFVYRMLNDAQEAEDVAQEVFVRVYRNARRFDPRALFSTWLFQIARNAALDRAKSRSRSGFFQSLEVSDEKVPMIGKNPAEELQSLEVSGQIAAAVAELPEEQRAALVLAEYEGRSYEEIAAIMKCSEKSVDSRLYRARQFLRERLRPLLREPAG